LVRFEGYKGRLYPGFYTDYLYRFQEVSKFFEYPPGSPAAWRKRYQHLLENWHGDREKISGQLVEYNGALGAAGTALSRARSLADPKSVVVLTGQQTGVATGPLSTLYKAVAVVSLAKKAEKELGVPVVPVFWLCSDDHDFREIEAIGLVDKKGRVRRVSLKFRPPAPRPVGEIPLPRQAVLGLIGDLEENHPGGPFAQEMLSLLRATAWEATSFPHWFALVLSRLLSPFGLVFLDPLKGHWVEAQVPVLQKALELGERINREIEATGWNLADLGYEPSLKLEPEHSHVFCHLSAGRAALFRRGGFLQTRYGNVQYTTGDLVQAVAAEPDRFSPNVVVRQMVQNHVLPVLVTVAGAGQVSYMAQLRSVYSLFGQQMPVVSPRLSLTLVEPWQEEMARRFGFELAEVLSSNWEEIVKNALDKVDKTGIDKAFGRARQAVMDLYRELMRELEKVSGDLGGLGAENRERVLAQLAYLEKKAHQHRRRQNRWLVERFWSLKNHLLPDGYPQERLLNIFPYLFRYGPGVIRDLVAGAVVEGVDGRHQLAYLDPDNGGE